MLTAPGAQVWVRLHRPRWLSLGLTAIARVNCLPNASRRGERLYVGHRSMRRMADEFLGLCCFQWARSLHQTRFWRSCGHCATAYATRTKSTAIDCGRTCWLLPSQTFDFGIKALELYQSRSGVPMWNLIYGCMWMSK